MNEIELLEGLLQRYSPTHQEAEAVNFLVAQMSAAGFAARVDEAGNAVGVIGDGASDDASDDVKEVMLLGHIDTVPGFIEVQHEDDRLYGRGAVDAKGPLACFTAASALAGARSGYRFVVIGAVGEEGDSRGAQWVRDHYKPDYLIIGEPSGWERVTLGYKGSAWYEYEVKRTLAHTSANVESACQAAVNFWNRVQDTGRPIQRRATQDVRSVDPVAARNALDVGWFCRHGPVEVQPACAAGDRSRRAGRINRVC